MSSEWTGTPVFVDPSGRRARWVHASFVTVGALASLYVATVGLSLVLPAGTLHLSVPGLGPVLPGPAPAAMSSSGDRQHKVAAQISTAEPSAAPADTAGSQALAPTVNPPLIGRPLDTSAATPPRSMVSRSTVSVSTAMPRLRPTQGVSSRPAEQPTAPPSPESTGGPTASSRPTPGARSVPARSTVRGRSPSPHPSHFKR